MDSNNHAYSSSKIVKYFADYRELQKPEKTILTLLKQNLPSLRMLDIGVGGGRTTLAFAPIVKEYVAIDYSKGMIDACIKKLSPLFPKAKFETTDVRNMKHFKDGEFDFILFSFNGLDYINNEERTGAIREIRRILKPGGAFCFSTHNIQSVRNTIDFTLRKNLIGWIKGIIDQKKILEINKENIGKRNEADYFFINDGAHDFSLLTYYCRPSYQIEELKIAGFKKIRVFSLNTGTEIIKKEEVNGAKDNWLYYLCQ